MNLDELERLAKEATPGPWHAWSDGGNRPRRRVGVSLPSHPVEDCGYLSHCIALTQDNGGGRVNSDANGQYIAAASPDVVLRLVAIARAAQRNVTTMRRLAVAMQWMTGPTAKPDDFEAITEEASAAERALCAALAPLPAETKE